MTQYPCLPAGMFCPGGEEDALIEVCDSLTLPLDVQLLHRTETTKSTGTIEKTVHRCMLKVTIDGIWLQCVGDGTAAEHTSKDSAWRVMIAKLRESGKLDDFNTRLRPKTQTIASTTSATWLLKGESVLPPSAPSHAAPDLEASRVTRNAAPSLKPSPPLPTSAQGAVYPARSASTTSSCATTLVAPLSASTTPQPSPSPSLCSVLPSGAPLHHTKNPTKPKLKLPTTRVEHRNAKHYVYNFAAQYSLVPDFTFKRINDTVRIQVSFGQTVAAGVSSHIWAAEGIALLELLRQMRGSSLLSSLPDASRSPVSCAAAMDYVTSHAASAGSTVDVEFVMETDRGTPVHWARVVIPGLDFAGPYVFLRRKVDAEVIAYLAAAVEISTGKSSTAAVVRPGMGALQSVQVPATRKVIKTTAPLSSLNVPTELLVILNACPSSFSSPTAGTALQAEQADASAAAGTSRRQARRQTKEEAAERNWILELEQEAYEDDPKLDPLHAQRSALPVSKYRQELKRMVDSSIYSIVIGDTGSGKTTQVPQILLEEAMRDGVVTVERDEPLQMGVGYHVRMDAKYSRYGGSIMYCTTGLFLEQMKHDADGILGSASHILIDEAHERALNVDFLLVVIKDAIKIRQTQGLSVPHVVLMSATIDHSLFARYLGTGEGKRLVPAPTIQIPGRTFPVTWRYLTDTLRDLMERDRREVNRLLATDPKVGDWLAAELEHSKTAVARKAGQTAKPQDLHEGFVPVPILAAIIGWLCSVSSDGAILVFLPGLQEITSLERFLTQHKCFGHDFADSRKYKICLLHSTIPKEYQAAVFQRDRFGCRKIILSTNIAETSITVTDVKHVVDTGKLRERRELVERYTEMSAVNIPELLRTDLSETVLSVKANVQGVAIQPFLAQAIEPPPTAAVQSAINSLKLLEALTAAEDLTDLGRVLSRFPVHPSLGKPILLGILYRCLDPMIVSAAAGDEKGLFLAPKEQRELANGRHEKYFTDNSDHMAHIRAFTALRAAFIGRGINAASRFSKEDFLHFGSFKTCMQNAEQIENILVESGLISRPSSSTRVKYQYGVSNLNRNSSNTALIKCLLVAGLQPNLAVKGNKKFFRTSSERMVMLQPGSRSARQNKATTLDPGLLFTYTTLVRPDKGDALFFRNASKISTLQAILFGGPLTMQGDARLLLNGWLLVEVPRDRQTGVAKKVLDFRNALHAMHTRAFKSLGECKTGQVGFGEDKARDEVVGALVKVLAAQGD
nr:hypothetical protein B0A51_02537 [Rachicladosporium sp. CCFEE 5018]OQO32465.1 hypothetical protein B0A51_00254 [Rachicladosporium sp. CCFEE 5018]